MAHDYITYLAINVLNEEKLVTYRALSRALKVHGTAAKKMLYDFHRQQNARRAGSVHATYLLSGVTSMQRTSDAGGNGRAEGGDVQMQSSPFMSSSTPHQDEEENVHLVKVVTLVREEHLEAAKAKYDEITSMHVYGLGPSSFQNLQLLSDCTREISVTYAKEDPLEAGIQYGVIQNPLVKRRTGRRPIIAAPPASHVRVVSKTTSQAMSTTILTEKETKKTGRPTDSSETKQDIKHSQSTGTSKKTATKPPAMKRDQSSIFQQFSKAKPKISREGTGSSVDTSPAVTTPQSEVASALEDEPMEDASEDEQEDDLVVSSAKSNASKRASKAEREEKLRKMMDDEDEPMENAPEEAPEQDVASKLASALVSQEDSRSEPPSTLPGGRRRGRRKVMKKKMLKDEEGYLVTKEEAAWESFSEDEPAPSAPPKPKTPASSNTAPVPTKGKKAGAKPGQGNIMNFFGKK